MPLNWGGGTYVYFTIKRRKKQLKDRENKKKEVLVWKEKKIKTHRKFPQFTTIIITAG